MKKGIVCLISSILMLSLLVGCSANEPAYVTLNNPFDVSITGIDWQGSLAAAPADPELGWGYYNTTDGTSYYYDGANWQTLAESAFGGGGGDMLKATYDPNDDGVIVAAQLDPSIIYEGDARLTDDRDPNAHAASHAVGGADSVFPADPDADKYLMWDDTAGNLSWEDAGGGIGDMTKAVYDPNDDGVIAAAQLDPDIIYTSDVDDTPADGATTDPISSNWAFDHEADTTTHGTTGAIVGTTDTQELDNKTLDSSVGKGTWAASGTWTLPAMTFGGDVTLGEVSILLDPAISADGKWSGMAETGTAGATLAFGDLVYYAAADSRWELADADTEAATNGKLGICIQAAAGDGSATTILLWGKVRADTAFPSMTVGAPVYVSTTDGDVTSTAPSATGDFVRVIGYANSADELFFCPDKTWLELA